MMRYSGSTTVQSIVFNNVNTAFTDANTITATVFHTLAAVRSASAVEIFQEGNTNGSTATTGTPSSGSAPFSLGTSVGVNQYLAGDIGEALLYNSALNSTQRGQVESYLRTRWGTT